MIKIKRVYNETPEPDDGTRFLVDRLWPRGITKEALQLDEWLKEAAPSNDLRRWYDHDPEKWEEFKRRYFAELDNSPTAWQPIMDAAQAGNVTLLYATRNTECNNAIALKEYVERALNRS